MNLVNAMCSKCEPDHVEHRLRPQLTDPDDEFVLETACHGRVDCIVTFNGREFEFAAKHFGIEAVLPAEMIRRLRNQSLRMQPTSGADWEARATAG